MEEKLQLTCQSNKASRFMGIDIRFLIMITFVLGDVNTAIGGTFFAARAGALQINSMDSILLDAIIIAVFSGVLFSRFRTMGIVLASILISMISTRMSMMGIKPEWIESMKGFIYSAFFLISHKIHGQKHHEEYCQYVY